jgi:alpha-D-xyloside xylohydrolase
LAGGRRAGAETLGDYATSRTDGRTVTITSRTGQQLRFTAYGDHIVRVRALRRGEPPFADDRYEMVVPENHARMRGTLRLHDGGAFLRLTTGAADGIEVVVQKKPLRLELRRARDHALLAGEDATRAITWTDGASTSAISKQCFAGAQPGERFFKAGTDFYGRSDRLDRTGTITAWNYGNQTNRGVYQAPVSLPFFLSTAGYAIFFNTTFDTTFVFDDQGRYEFSATDDGAGGDRPQLDYFVIAGPSFRAMIDRYTTLTGRPRLPREAIFGLQLSDKNFPTVSGSQWWQEKITAHRAAGFPLDVQVNDNRWRDPNGRREGSQFRFWTAPGGSWHQPTPEQFKHWADMTGIVSVLDYNRNNSNEMLGWRPGPPPGYSLDPRELADVADNDAVPDFTSPATRRWVWDALWATLDPARGLPGDALWLDETDELYKIPAGARCANGRRWAEVRNNYTFLLQKAVGEGWNRALPSRRPWTFSRGATAGMQRFGHFWSGDIESTYAEMAAQIRGIQAAGLGGFPFANHDAGGFHGRVIPAAMYRQWVAAFASFAPIWRPHSEANTASVDIGAGASRWPLDHPAVEQADFMKYARERYRLMPYIYSLAREAAATGLPLARAMVIDYQDNPKAWAHDLQYQWGPAFIVAPNPSDGGTAIDVWLPAGDTWYDYWNDRALAGSDTADHRTTPATAQLPLFVKNGAIVPRYRYARSVQEMDRSALELDVYAGKDGAFELIEDDGISEDFARPARSQKTQLTFEDARRRLTIVQPRGHYAGAPVRRWFTVRLHGYAGPVGMRVDGGGDLPAFADEAAARGAGGGVSWDAASKVLSIVTAPIQVRPGALIVIEASGTPFVNPAN